LSAGFQPVPLQPDDRPRNSDQTDYGERVQAAWTPNGRDQFSFSYVRHSAEKGNPPYAGVDPAVNPRFWRWPQWDKQDFYLIGSRSVGTSSYLKVRLYYDQFNSLVRAFDDSTYDTRRRRSSFNSRYDDDAGAMLEWDGCRYGPTLSRHPFTSYFRDDTHREGNLGEPQRSFRDRIRSTGVEDTVRLKARRTGVLGFRADYLDVLNAED
jgi:iron complex outermembrane receptor protein